MSQGRPFFLLPLVVVVYFLLIAPLLVVIGVSFNAGAGFDFPPKGLSLRWYEAFFESRSFTRSFFQVSLVVATACAFGAVTVGTLAAIGLVRFRFRGRHLFDSFFLAPLLVPHILLGAALYLFYARMSINASIYTLFLGHLLIATPYVIRSVTAGLAGMDPRLEEAAMSLGASRVQAFVKVTLPLFLSGPDTTTLPVHIFSQIQWDGDPTIAAASTLQIVVIFGLILLAQKIFKLRLMV